jgi:hypothetical protein
MHDADAPLRVAGKPKRTSRDFRRQHGHRTQHAAHNRSLRPYATTSFRGAEARLHAQRAQHVRQHHCSPPTCGRMPHASGALAALYARPAGTHAVEGDVPRWHAPRRELKARPARHSMPNRPAGGRTVVVQPVDPERIACSATPHATWIAERADLSAGGVRAQGEREMGMADGSQHQLETGSALWPCRASSICASQTGAPPFA